MHYGYLLFLSSVICYVTAAPEFYSDIGEFTEPHVESIKPAFRVKRFQGILNRLINEDDTLIKEESLEKHGEEPFPEELGEHEEETMLDDQMDQQEQQELYRKKRHFI